MAVAKRLSTDTETFCAPRACPHKDGLVAVTKEIVHRKRTTDRRVRADVDAERVELFLVAVKGRGRQTKIGDAVAQHSADALHPLKDRDTVALLCKFDRDDDSGRTRTDDGDIVSVVGFALKHELVEIGVRDVVFDARDLNR